MENILGYSQESLVQGHRKKDLLQSGGTSETSNRRPSCKLGGICIRWLIRLRVHVHDYFRQRMKKYDLTKKTSECNHRHSSLSFLWEKAGLCLKLCSEGNVYRNLFSIKYLCMCVFFVWGNLPTRLTYL